MAVTKVEVDKRRLNIGINELLPSAAKSRKRCPRGRRTFEKLLVQIDLSLGDYRGISTIYRSNDVTSTLTGHCGNYARRCIASLT